MFEMVFEDCPCIKTAKAKENDIRNRYFNIGLYSILTNFEIKIEISKKANLFQLLFQSSGLWLT